MLTLSGESQVRPKDMIEIETYLDKLHALARECVDADISAYLFLRDRLEERDESTLSVVDFRREFLSVRDEESVMGLLPTGYFSELVDKTRIAAFVVCTELEREISNVSHDRRFEPYHEAQPLFLHLPQYLSAAVNSELLPYEIVGQPRGDGVTKVGSSFLRIEPYLHPTLVSWSRSTFPDLSLFLRLDPYFLRSEEPLLRLLETILIPADPSWWANLNAYPRQPKGSAYLLEPSVDPRDDLQEYWDFHVRHLRRLEVHAIRRGPDYFSMMVEGLADLREVNGFVLGRVIHWDTTEPQGKAVEAANVQHLDLAIHLYRESDAEARMSQNLAHGRVQDATQRTHLLRIEGIRANAVLAFAHQFFQSKSLLHDWFNDQFGGAQH
jgi:hypothetical protein